MTNNYKENLTFDELINLTLAALKESIDDEATKENVRLAYIKSENKQFYMCSKDEVEGFLNLLK